MAGTRCAPSQGLEAQAGSSTFTDSTYTRTPWKEASSLRNKETENFLRIFTTLRAYVL